MPNSSSNDRRSRRSNRSSRRRPRRPDSPYPRYDPADYPDSPSPYQGDFDIFYCEGCQAWFADVPAETSRHRDCLALRLEAEARAEEELRRLEEEACAKDREGRERGDSGNDHEGEGDVASAA